MRRGFGWTPSEGNDLLRLRASPPLNLALHRLKVSLDPVHSNRKCIDQVETLAVLGQDRRERAWDNVGKSLACC